MRLWGSQPSLFQRMLPWLATLIVLAVLVAGAFLMRQQQESLLVAQGRASAAEVQLTEVSATLTAVVRAQTSASATALAIANDPKSAVERALGLVYLAYQEPTDAHARALADAFSPGALAVFQPEFAHLQSEQLHLGGSSAFAVNVLSSTPTSTDQVEVGTQEQWTYDELNASDARVRCLREDSEQTYTLRRVAGGWLVDQVQLGASRRTQC